MTHASRFLGAIGLCLSCVACSGGHASTGPGHSSTPDGDPTVLATVPVDVITVDTAFLRQRYYTVDYHVIGALPNGRTLLVFHSICTGSADGHCQAIDAFRVGDRKPLWHGDYAGVLGIRPSSGGFSIRSSSYAKGDPLGLPSLPPVTDTFTWNGSHFIERGLLPHPPGG